MHSLRFRGKREFIFTICVKGPPFLIFQSILHRLRFREDPPVDYSTERQVVTRIQSLIGLAKEKRISCLILRKEIPSQSTLKHIYPPFTEGRRAFYIDSRGLHLKIMSRRFKRILVNQHDTFRKFHKRLTFAFGQAITVQSSCIRAPGDACIHGFFT